MKINCVKIIRRISFDVVINLAGSGIALLVLHFVIYPRIAKLLSGDAYGEMQSIMSSVFLISGTFGGTLSTVRLIRNYDYKEKEVEGDFKHLLFGSLFSNVILISLFLIFYLKEANLKQIVLVVIVALLNITSEYFCMGLRLMLDYKKIFWEQVVGCLGYLIGYLIFKKTLTWQWVFIIAYLFKTIFCILNSTLITESFKKTILFKKTVCTFFYLGVATFLNNSLTYFDKLLLYPLLGGTAVSIYYVANIFGKLIIQALGPITNVALSYLSQQKNVSKKLWKIVLPISIGFCLLLYITCLIISRPILNILYSQWAEQALRLLPITSLALCVSALVHILYPFSLKMLDEKKQIVINVIGLLTYVAITLLTYKTYGLMGCSLALLFSYFFKLMSIIFLSASELRKNDYAKI